MSKTPEQKAVDKAAKLEQLRLAEEARRAALTQEERDAEDSAKNTQSNTTDSAAKQAYSDLIEVYAKQNPVKFAAKQAELKAKLASL